MFLENQKFSIVTVTEKLTIHSLFIVKATYLCCHLWFDVVVVYLFVGFSMEEHIARNEILKTATRPLGTRADYVICE